MKTKEDYYVRKAREAKERFRSRMYKYAMNKNVNALPILLSHLKVMKPATFRSYLLSVDEVFHYYISRHVPTSISKDKPSYSVVKSIKPNKVRR